jgi:hypothetical protein
MDCGERMTRQVDMQVAAYPHSKSKYMVYRNFVKAFLALVNGGAR